MIDTMTLLIAIAVAAVVLTAYALGYHDGKESLRRFFREGRR